MTGIANARLSIFVSEKLLLWSRSCNSWESLQTLTAVEICILRAPLPLKILVFIFNRMVLKAVISRKVLG